MIAAAMHPVLASAVLNPLDWVSALRWPIGGLIYVLSNAFNAVGPLQWIGPLGLAIVVATLIIRGMLFPIFRWNIRTQRRVQREQRLLSPQINEIRRRYKGQGRRMQEEIQKVYAEHGVSMFSPMSGCLPLLVQLPVLYGLYWGIRDVIGIGTTWGGTAITFDRLSAAVHLNFLWIPDVSRTIAQQVGTASGHACSAAATTCPTDWAHLFTNPANLALLIFPILTGITYFVQSKMTMQPLRPDMSDTERQMASSMRTVVYFMPLMSVFFGFVWPQGLTLYWFTAALVMVGQQFGLMGWGSMRVPGWFPGARRVGPLSYQSADFGMPRTPVVSPSPNGHPRAAPRRGARTTGTSAVGGAPGTGRPPARAQKRARRRR
jgi:YidC/Oxa1 family membrane protein insertase